MKIFLFLLAGAVGPMVAAPSYLDIVQAYADAMISDGTDKYGKVQSPLFAAALDRKTLVLLDKATPTMPGIRASDRALRGANPLHDENLYQVLYALANITLEPKYSVAADKSLRWFFENCQSPVTGLMAWGEHLSWDFREEKVAVAVGDQDFHELYRPWVLMEHTFRLAPKAMVRFAEGLWEHQIHDQSTGAFDRHASYSHHAPRTGGESPRHAGLYIATWMAAYEHSGEPKFLRAIEVILAGMESRRNAKTGVMPSTSSTPEHLTPRANVNLAIDLWDGSQKAPAELAKKMRLSASEIDRTYLSMKQDLSPGGKGFFKAAFASSLEPGDIRAVGVAKPAPNWFPYSRTWVTGYGMATDAEIAMLCLLRYRQVKDDRYRRLVIAASERYLNSSPDRSQIVYPGAMADAIALMLGTYRLTGDNRYFTSVR